jgi:hypothetical protein
VQPQQRLPVAGDFPRLLDAVDLDNHSRTQHVSRFSCSVSDVHCHLVHDGLLIPGH